MQSNKTHSKIKIFHTDRKYNVLNKSDCKFIIPKFIDFATREKTTIKDLSFIFMGDNELSEINYSFKKKYNYTDVLAFDMRNDYLKKEVSGEIYISIPRVRENAKKYKKTLYNELLRVMIHGFLHLVGYTDNNKKNRLIMTVLEDKYLKRLSTLTNLSKK